MTRQADPMFDERIADWLEEDPERAPAAVLDTILAAFPSIPQRRGTPMWRRFGSASPVERLASAAAVILAIGVAGLAIVGRGPFAGQGGQPSNAPPGWQEFVSPDDDYVIRLPAGWTMDPGTAGQSDVFTGPEGKLQIARELVLPNDQDAWRDAHVAAVAAQLGGSCADVPQAPFDTLTLASDGDRLYALPCLPGWLVVATLGDRGYDLRFTIRDPVAMSARGKDFVMNILRTTTLGGGPWPTSRVLSLTGYTSPLYGYSIQRPDGWKVSSATQRLGALDVPWADSVSVDLLESSVASDPDALHGQLILAATDVPAGTTLAQWTDSVAVATCGTAVRREVIEIGGTTASLLEFGNCFGLFHQWVTVLDGTRAYHIVWLDGLGNEAADRAIFRAILATFAFPS
jgi:hypothetical protein